MVAINKLTASLKLKDVLTPNARQIREMILDALIIRDIGDEITLSPLAIKLLCATLEQAVRDEFAWDTTGTKKPPLFMRGQKAIERFSKAYMEGFRAEFPDEPTTSEHALRWPDGLPTDALLPVEMLDYAGHIMGIRTADNVKYWNAYRIKHMGDLIS